MQRQTFKHAPTVHGSICAPIVWQRGQAIMSSFRSHNHKVVCCHYQNHWDYRKKSDSFAPVGALAARCLAVATGRRTRRCNTEISWNLTEAFWHSDLTFSFNMEIQFLETGPGLCYVNCFSRTLCTWQQLTLLFEMSWLNPGLKLIW